MLNHLQVGCFQSCRGMVLRPNLADVCSCARLRHPHDRCAMRSVAWASEVLDDTAYSVVRSEILIRSGSREMDGIRQFPRHSFHAPSHALARTVQDANSVSAQPRRPSHQCALQQEPPSCLQLTVTMRARRTSGERREWRWHSHQRLK